MSYAAFIGAGNMGSAIIRGACTALGAQQVCIFDPATAAMEALSKETGCRTAATAHDAVQGADYVFLCVKPQILPGVVEGLAPSLQQRGQAGEAFTLVSIAAGVQVSALEQMLESFALRLPVIRIMPNLCANVGAAVMLVSPSQSVTPAELDPLKEIIAPCGLVEIVDEHTLDLGTAISGCAPAFVYMFIEALADGGVQIGLPRAKAQLYAAQTVLGAAEMVLHTGDHPGALKDAVCSPGGSTIAGVAELENRGFRAAAAQAVVSACRRTLELGK